MRGRAHPADARHHHRHLGCRDALHKLVEAAQFRGLEVRREHLPVDLFDGDLRVAFDTAEGKD
jgi:hypothetical protein